MGTFTEELSFGNYKSGIWDEPPAYRTIRFGAFSPLELFAGGEQGFWYDPSDLSTVWQNAARTIPGAVDQPVGCIDDKSGRGNNATQSTALSRPILRKSGSLYYLEFDGVDDGLATGTITPDTDKMQIMTGVFKLSDGGKGIIAEHSLTSANAGCFALEGPSAALASDFRYVSGGSLGAAGAAQATGLASPVTKVVTGLGDIAGDSSIIRINGMQAASSVADQGTGNYTAQVTYLGRRGDTTSPFTGNLYAMVCRFGANLTAGQLGQTESWIAAKTGVTL